MDELSTPAMSSTVSTSHNWKQWWRRWGSTIMLALTLLTLPVVFWFGYRMRQRQRPPGSWSTTVAMILAVEGIVFGVYGLLEAHVQRKAAGRRWAEHVNRMNAVTEQLTRLAKGTKDLQEQASTRFIGAFPKHLDDIIEIAEKVEGNFLMMADCADYGSFVKPEAHDRLYRAIETALTKNALPAI